MNISNKSKVTPHFTFDEFFYGIFKNDVIKYNDDLLITPQAINHAQMLEEFRVWLNKPMKVNAWYRGEKFNKSVGGTSNSGHREGTATDIGLYVSYQVFLSYWNKWKAICKEHNSVACMGYYPEKKFIHFESQPTWTNKNTLWREEKGKLIYL